MGQIRHKRAPILQGTRTIAVHASQCHIPVRTRDIQNPETCRWASPDAQETRNNTQMITTRAPPRHSSQRPTPRCERAGHEYRPRETKCRLQKSHDAKHKTMRREAQTCKRGKTRCAQHEQQITANGSIQYASCAPLKVRHGPIITCSFQECKQYTTSECAKRLVRRKRGAGNPSRPEGPPPPSQRSRVRRRSQSKPLAQRIKCNVSNASNDRGPTHTTRPTSQKTQSLTPPPLLEKSPELPLRKFPEYHPFAKSPSTSPLCTNPKNLSRFVKTSQNLTPIKNRPSARF